MDKQSSFPVALSETAHWMTQEDVRGCVCRKVKSASSSGTELVGVTACSSPVNCKGDFTTFFFCPGFSPLEVLLL